MAKTESQNKPSTEFTFNPEAHKAKENSTSWKKTESKKESK